jgi:hypothetical protein
MGLTSWLELCGTIFAFCKPDIRQPLLITPARTGRWKNMVTRLEKGSVISSSPTKSELVRKFTAFFRKWVKLGRNGSENL